MPRSFKSLVKSFVSWFGSPSRLNAQAAADDLTHGNVMYSMGEYDEAIFDYNRALAVHPKYADAYCNRDSAWRAKGEYDKAISDYNQFLVINPNDANAYTNRGNAWLGRGEYDKAISDYNNALTFDPTNVAAYDNLAWLQATCSADTAVGRPPPKGRNSSCRRTPA